MSTRHETLECGTPSGRLHRWFDGDLLDEKLSRHVRDCSHCTAELERVERQRDALAHLTGPSRGVDAALEAARRAAQAALGDRLAELALACLATSSAQAPASEPASTKTRAWAIVRAEVTLLSSRLEPLGVPLDTAELPDRAPTRAERHEFAWRCLTVLTRLEGPSDRARAIATHCTDIEGDASAEE